MAHSTPTHTPNTKNNISRRQFVKGMALTTVAATLASQIPNALAKNEFISHAIGLPKQPILSGTEFDLTIAEQRVNVTGSPRIATLINGTLTGPTLVFQEGDTVTLRVKNELNVDSSIHWHGLILPYEMDGVPGISFDGIKPGETFVYQFKVVQNGTYWYHSHSGFQEQTGVYGAIVILPKKPEPVEADHDYVIQLSDWSDTPPETLYSNLKKMGDYYNYNQRTVGDFWSEIKEKGFSKAWQDRSMWNSMPMSDRDLSDVSGATYTYLMNGLSPNAHWRAVVDSGKKVRLRFINASAMTFFDVRIPGLKMSVIAADGNLIQPVEVDEFRIGVAETYDVIVEPDTQNQPYAIFAQAIDRSGYAIGSLTTNGSQLASAPEMDPYPILTMTDMGMAHNMSDMSNMSETSEHAGHSMDNKMQGMNHSSMPKKSKMNSMDHSGHNMTKMNTIKGNMDHMVIPMDMNPNLPQIEVPRKDGPQIDMRAKSPQYRLDDPGVGLRNNGRKVLTYADLKNLYPTRHEPKPTKELVLHLTGNMERFIWSMDGLKLNEAKPIHFPLGERIRIILHNDSNMLHPMHLHGMWSDLESAEGGFQVRKHTITVQPAQRVSFLVTVDAPGRWAFHCHLLYHMAAGMFREVVVA
ncbi:MAG: copper resistance system multicopper oxidase [Thiomicrorhabdus sp.]|nr:copper resistance system multicopper oxidase [Thiomicrorhabdus sp.]